MQVVFSYLHKSDFHLLWCTINLEFKLLFKVTQCGTGKLDLYSLMSPGHQDTLSWIECKAFAKCCARRQQGIYSVDGAFVSHHYFIDVRGADKDITHIQAVTRKLDLIRNTEVDTLKIDQSIDILIY